LQFNRKAGEILIKQIKYVISLFSYIFQTEQKTSYSPMMQPNSDISNLSDLELLTQIGVRNTAAMEVFYKRHASAIYAFCHRRMADAALADEVTNDTLLQVWQSASSFAQLSSAKTWLLGIAKNKTLDALRKRGRADAREQYTSDEDQQAFADTAPAAYAQLLAKQQSHHLGACFEQLPPEQRSCMHLSFVDGLTLAEIAYVMGIPAKTAATRIHHAKRKLRECMECIFGKGEVL
jgi:RNA polymerase sigma-70 factor, ECF subfamily